MRGFLFLLGVLSKIRKCLSFKLEIAQEDLDGKPCLDSGTYKIGIF